MKEEDIKKILEIIISKLDNKKFTWRIEGSANLKIQGVDVSVRDLDITTNDEGIEIFRNTLEHFIVKDFFSDKINGQSVICYVNGFEVEINSYGDRKKNMFDKIQIMEWNNLRIPILPLKNALEFYRLIGYEKKVDLISNYL